MNILYRHQHGGNFRFVNKLEGEKSIIEGIEGSTDEEKKNKKQRIINIISNPDGFISIIKGQKIEDVANFMKKTLNDYRDFIAEIVEDDYVLSSRAKSLYEIYGLKLESGE